MIEWRLSEIVRCAGGELVGNDAAFTSVSTVIFMMFSSP